MAAACGCSLKHATRQLFFCSCCGFSMLQGAKQLFLGIAICHSWGLGFRVWGLGFRVLIVVIVVIIVTILQPGGAGVSPFRYARMAESHRGGRTLVCGCMLDLLAQGLGFWVMQ